LNMANSTNELQKSWGWFLAVGILMIVGGACAFFAPFMVSLAVEVIVGAFFAVGGIVMLVQVFTTKDGWIQVVALKDHEYQKACKALGLTDLATDPRLQKSAGRSQHLDLINNRAIEVLKTKTSMEWRDILTEAGVQNEIMQNYCEFIEHPHTAATGLISWLPQAGWDTPWPVPNLPGIPQLEEGQPLAISPVKGQHSRELLAEFGYPSEGIEELFTSGIVLEPCHDEPSND